MHITSAIKNIAKRILPEWILVRIAHPGFRKYFKNTGWLFFGKALSLVASFFVGAYIARYLGPDQYGLLNYIISFVGIFAFITSFGIDTVVSRELVANKDGRGNILGSAMGIKVLGSFSAIFCVFIFSMLLADDARVLPLLWIFSLSYVPAIFNVFETYFQSQVLSHKVVIAQILSSIVATLLKVAGIFFQFGILYFIIVLIAESALYSFFLILTFVKNKDHYTRLVFSKRVARYLIANSWPLMFSTVAVSIYMKIDQVIIKNMLDATATGLYATAAKLSEVWYFIPSILIVSLFPAIVNAKNTDETAYRRRLQNLYSFLIWSGIIISSLLFIFSKDAIVFIFGDAYVGASPAFRIYIWSTVFVYAQFILGHYFILENMSKQWLYATLIGGFLNVVLNIYLIPRHGISGAAAATVFSYSAVIAASVFFKRSRGQLLLMAKSLLFIK